MSVFDKTFAGKSLKGWSMLFIYIIIVYIIILVILCIVRYMLEERWKAEKKLETIDLTGYTGDILNPFAIIGDITLLLKQK